MSESPRRYSVDSSSRLRLGAWRGARAASTWYLLEFRIDAWPNALLFWAVYRYRARAVPSFGATFELAVLSTLAVLCAPKLVLFIVLFALGSLMVGERRWPRALGARDGPPLVVSATE